jgi:hypothetical protein
VDIDSKVCAAAVYRAFRVAAGCGVAAAKGPLQARIIARAANGRISFLKYLVIIDFSNGISNWL